MTFDEIRDYLASNHLPIIDDGQFNLSESFQGTIGRMLWFEASNIDPKDYAEDVMLVSVERPLDGQHIHIEVSKGHIEETLSHTPGGREFERISGIVSYEKWLELMVRQMKDSYDEGI